MARGACKLVSVNGALTVTFTTASGVTPVVFSDEACTTTVALPATVADGASTTFYFSAPGAYVLSVKTSTGTQIAGDANNTRIITVAAGQTATLAYDARFLSIIAGDTGRSAAASAGAAVALPTSASKSDGIPGPYDGYDVILLPGQSNMVGYDTAAVDATHLDPTDAHIYQWATSGTYQSSISLASDPLVHPDNISNIKVGPGMEFARWYVRANPGRRVLLVPAAVGGTGFSSAYPNTWDSTATTGSLYWNAIGYANAAMAAAHNSRLVAIIWHQGEADAFTNMTGATYQTNLLALIDGMRANIIGATSSTPFILGRQVPEFVALAGGAAGTADQIDAIHVAVPGLRNYTAVSQPPSGFSTGANNIHYTNAGQRVNGRRYFACLTDALNNTGTVTVPGEPVTPVAAPAGATSATVTWKAPWNGGSALSDYSIQYQQAGASSWSTWAHTASTATSATVTGLTNGKTYAFRIAGVNAQGTGAYSTLSIAKIAAPGVPTGFGVTVGDTQLVLGWTAPADAGGSAITNYKVYRTAANGATGTETLLTTLGNVLTFTDTGLTNGATYRYKISAVNVVGESTLTAEQSATPTSAIRVSDTFTRADSATSAGTADTGQTWNAVSGTWGISSNQLYVAATGGNSVLLVNATGSSDMTVTVTNNATFDGNGGGIYARSDSTGANGYVALNQNGVVKVYKMITGTLTQISATSGTALAVGDTLTLQVAGSTITVKQNGATTIGPFTDTSVTTGTYTGFWRFGTSGPKWDNFQCI